ncbi:HAMP domain-containing sensor histidine kinase [Puia sp.]|jgi:signal transduction histidine kinase|uniref:sensor histidine kinase n=1 Tax=Puia sp. TaxID=2045100 RepID=UPI002F4192F0
MKLNNKTIRNYLVYSSALFLLTIPVFYLVVRKVLLHAVDRSLRIQFHETREHIGLIQSEQELAIWAKMDNDISISPLTIPQQDRIYTIDRFNRRHREAEPYREMAGTVTVSGRPYELIIRSSLIENEDLLGSILFVQTTVLFILVMGILWINQRMSKRLWQPFYIALRTMQDFEVNKRADPVFMASTTDEFNQLKKAIEQLFSRSQQLFLQQREFTENAAHEMQTPVAILQSKLELLMQTTPLSREQAELINILDYTIRRITKLNKSLLLLAKIENNQYNMIERIDLREACERMIGHLDILAQEKDIIIHQHYQPEVFVYADPALIDILIGNLLSNAIRHNDKCGDILVTLDHRELIISNTGDEVPLVGGRIFARFHKQSRQEGNEDSTGLGLAIVKNICALYHYKVNYNYIKSRHAFSVCFNTSRDGIPVSSRIPV